MNVTNITKFVVRNDTINAFVSEINKTTVPTAQEEKDLFVRYESAKTEEEKIAIRNEIISRNMRFVYAVAKRYNNDEMLPDLINEGVMGMMQAFEEYDWRSGNRFTTLAVWYIRRAINGYLNKENLLVRPKNGARIIPKVKRIESDFIMQNGRKPTAFEVAEILKRDFDIDIKDESDLYGTRVEKIEQHIGEDEDNTFEKSNVFVEKTSVNNEYETESDKDAMKFVLNECLKALTDREKTIICMAYGYGYDREYKDKEIADEMGLTSERVRQLRHSAVKKMRSTYLATENR